jgi:hypothetical protein
LSPLTPLVLGRLVDEAWAVTEQIKRETPWSDEDVTADGMQAVAITVLLETCGEVSARTAEAMLATLGDTRPEFRIVWATPHLRLIPLTVAHSRPGVDGVRLVVCLFWAQREGLVTPRQVLSAPMDAAKVAEAAWLGWRAGGES